MRHLHFAPGLLPLLLSLAACTGTTSSVGGWTPPADPDRLLAPTAAPSDVSALVAVNNDFAVRLHSALSAKGGNLVYSPYDISLNMAELTNDVGGANLAGVKKAMGFSMATSTLNTAFDALDLELTGITGKTAESSVGLQFQEATAAWGMLAHAPALAKYYGATVLSGNDPSSALAAWQATVSPGPVLPVHIIGDADGVLATLVHFDGAWQTGFDPSLTAPAPFTRLDKTTASVPFMNTEGTFKVTGASATTQAIELPYDGGRLAMLIVEPSDLPSFEKSLTSKVLSDLVASLNANDGQISIPKFSITYNLEVLKILQGMGIGLDSGHWEIDQAADIQVTENGTVATAVTSTSSTPSVALGSIFAADHPFDYFIRDTVTGSILFAGRVVDPSAS